MTTGPKNRPFKNGVSYYIIHLLRWGSDENHSYFWGLFTDYDKAEHEAKVGMALRAGKYDAIILRAIPDELEWEKCRTIRWGDFDPQEYGY